MSNRPLSNYASVPANNNLKSRLRENTADVLHSTVPSSTSGYCSWELKRNSKIVYLLNPFIAVTPERGDGVFTKLMQSVLLTIHLSVNSQDNKV